MNKRCYFFIFISGIFFVFENIFSGVDNNIKLLSSDIAGIKKPIDQIHLQMRDYYLSLLAHNELLQEKEISLNILKNKMDILNKNSKEIENEIKVKIKKILIMKLDEVSEVEDIVRYRNEMKIYKRQEQLLRINQEELTKLNNQMLEIKLDVEKLRTTGFELKKVIDELSLRKENHYKISKIVMKDNQKRELYNHDSALLNYLSTLNNRLLPLKKLSAIERQNKGVLMKINQPQDLYSIQRGQVIYIGTLSTFGHVLILDHGHGETSIFLGDFSPTVNKKEMIYEGQKLGEASVGKNFIYFEIRRNNVAINTVEWMKNKEMI
jgi:hypothetical protein